MRVVLGCALAMGLLLASGCSESDPGATTTEPGAAATETPSPEAAAATPSSAPPIGVVAATDFYGDIAEQVGGDRVSVTSIITEPGQDPHSFEASARTQLAVSEAAVIIENGGGYDDFMPRLRNAADFSGPVLDATEVVLAGTPGPDSGEEVNEHVWYDLGAMVGLADTIAGTLADLDPGSRTLYDTNADAFGEQVAQRQARAEAIREAHDGAVVAITEPVPVYLLEACGLVNRTPAEFSEAIEEGTDVPARTLAEMLDLVSGDEVRALVYNEQTAGPQTEQVREAAEENEVPVISVTETLPEGSDYITWMGRNLDEIESALTQPAPDQPALD